MRSLPIDARLTIANMTTEFGALSGLFPIDGVLEGWLRGYVDSRVFSLSIIEIPIPERLLTSQVIPQTSYGSVLF